ncbi:L,D-transpeptidase family protein [Eggerthellaceae bacterium zg-893]|nr:L,D-transpeptidase family protein [Eggerthellaceae bacterium zg-893]
MKSSGAVMQDPGLAELISVSLGRFRSTMAQRPERRAAMCEKPLHAKHLPTTAVLLLIGATLAGCLALSPTPAFAADDTGTPPSDQVIGAPNDGTDAPALPPASEPDQPGATSAPDGSNDAETPDDPADPNDPGADKPDPFPAQGWTTDESGRRFYYDGKSADPLTGWLSLDGKNYYLRPDQGGAVATGLFRVGGAQYIADSLGARCQERWASVDGKQYWCNKQGRPVTGWFKQKGVSCYLDPANNGAKTFGWKKLGKSWYYFNPTNGVLQTGWIKDGKTWYYADNRGVMKTGWQKVGKKWYHLKKNGAMSTGWLKDRGTWYHLKSSGAMSTGWVKDGKTWYYLDKKSGAMKTGWQKVGKKWYHLKKNGAMSTGWLKDKGTWYLLDEKSGAMLTGTNWANGKAYYLDSSGAWSDDHGMTNKAQKYSSPTKYMILIDCYHNEFGVYQGSKGNWKRIRFWPCSTGAYSTPTVKGVYHAGIKGLGFGNGFTCWYYTQILGDYLIHSGEYVQGSMTQILDNRMGVNISHGCVRLTLPRAKWVYNTIPSGSTIVTY